MRAQIVHRVGIRIEVAFLVYVERLEQVAEISRVDPEEEGHSWEYDIYSIDIASGARDLVSLISRVLSVYSYLISFRNAKGSVSVVDVARDWLVSTVAAMICLAAKAVMA